MENQSGGGSLIGAIVPLLLFVFIFISMWKVFTKAGHPGWAVIIPIYNIYVLCKIAGKPGWWVLLMFIPLVNVVISLLLALGIAQSFGKGAGFGIGIFFLPFIFYPVLAFSDASYGGGGGGGSSSPIPATT